jgi:hypothetical protein
VPTSLAGEEVPTRDCSTRAEPSRGRLAIDHRRDIVVGPVAFSGLRGADARSVSRHDGVFSRKSAVKVRAGRAVTLVVPEAVRNRLWLVYARPGSFGDPAIRFWQTRLLPCPPNMPGFRRGTTVGALTGFTGGFVFTRRGCYSLEVWVDGRPEPFRRTIPLGVPSCS